MRALFRIAFFAAIMIAAVAASSGCASILEDDRLVVSAHHSEPQERPAEEQLIEISSYEELREEMMRLVMEFAESGKLIAYSYDGDISADIARARVEIMNVDPVGAYAVSSITGVATRIVSYSEVEISIEYKRTKQQVDSIVNVSTLRYLRIELLSVMSQYLDEALFRTSLQITDEEIDSIVRELYYQNPRSIVMLPVIVAERFPSQGSERVYELRFRYIEESGIMQQYDTNLSRYVRRNAELAVGDNDAEILLSLVEHLMAACAYEQGLARTISVHGAQNLAATAYGALVNGRAVGEGYAMAFKALSDELGFDCRIVLGNLGEMIHAWNIVMLYGEYYHIDVAMCDVYGIETAFLKTDADFAELYSWDLDNTIRCNGTLTYEDIVVPEEEEPDETDETDDTDDPENGGEEPGDPGDAGEPPGQPVDPGEETPDQPDEPEDDTEA